MASDPELPETTPTTPTPATQLGGATMFNLARGAKLVALLLFMLPWVTISCADQTLATMSGYDLATGSVTVANPMGGGGTTTPPSSGNEQPDIPVLIAAILIVAGLALTFVLARSMAALAAMACCAGAAALISYTVFVKVPDRALSNPSAGGAGGDSGGMFNEQQIAEMIRIDYAMGFWLTLGALGLAIILNWLARSKAG